MTTIAAPDPILTYRYRVKSLTGELNRLAKAVNIIWNFANDTQKHALKWGKKWPSAYDIQKLTAGTSRDLGIASSSIDAVSCRYVQNRRQQRRPYLRYRGRNNLGWIPMKGRDISLKPEGFRYYGKTYRLFMSRQLPMGAKILDGCSFSQDSRGHWYVNLVLRVPRSKRTNQSAVGIDLGLKSLAALSDGSTIAAPRHFRMLEQKLATSQRARKRRITRNINMKITAKRRDFLHKASNDIANRFGIIAVGNVNAAKLKKVMGKSVSDAGWTDFRNMLRYKAIGRGGRYFEVNEANTTRCCAECGSLSGPKGRKALGIRAWICGDCGEPHERDHNAAKNILRLGYQALSVGIAA